MSYIKIKNKNNKKVDSLTSPYQYKSIDYGYSSKKFGAGIKIAIIDSGCPQHKDIDVKGQKINFCEHTENIYDINGHSTMISGVISANNIKGIRGLSPFSEINFIKVFDDSGNCSFNNLISGVLWAIVKEIDIILISLGTQCDYVSLKDVIKKAHESNICIIAAAGSRAKEKLNNVDFPARYPEVLSIDCSVRNKKDTKRKVDFWLPNKITPTTYLNNKYVKVGGSSMAAAKVVGLVALILENDSSIKKQYDFHLKLRCKLEKLLKR